MLQLLAHPCCAKGVIFQQPARESLIKFGAFSRSVKYRKISAALTRRRVVECSRRGPQQACLLGWRSGSPASLLAGVEVREANLGLFVSFWRISRHVARLGLGRARSLAVPVRWHNWGFSPRGMGSKSYLEKARIPRSDTFFVSDGRQTSCIETC
jgi:hypothetical protein